MATYATVTPGPALDGVPYATNTPLTTTEADLNNAVPVSQGNPVGVRYNEALIAVVVFTATGSIGTNNSYVVLQTTLDGKTWVDLAWAVWNGTSGSATFILSGGVAGALGVQNSRAAGTAPGSSGAIQVPLGGAIRFVGKATTSAPSSSSSSSGASASSSGPASVSVSITFKMVGLR